MSLEQREIVNERNFVTHITTTSYNIPEDKEAGKNISRLYQDKHNSCEINRRNNKKDK